MLDPISPFFQAITVVDLSTQLAASAAQGTLATDLALLDAVLEAGGGQRGVLDEAAWSKVQWQGGRLGLGRVGRFLAKEEALKIVSAVLLPTPVSPPLSMETCAASSRPAFVPRRMREEAQKSPPPQSQERPVKRVLVPVNRDRLREAILQSIQRGVTDLKKLIPCAYRIYCEGLDSSAHPNRKHFKNLFHGKKSPFITLLREYGVVRQRRVPIDPKRAQRALVKAAAQMGDSAPPSAVAKRAHQLYMRGIPNERGPTVQGFRDLLRRGQKRSAAS